VVVPPFGMIVRPVATRQRGSVHVPGGLGESRWHTALTGRQAAYTAAHKILVGVLDENLS